MSKSSTSGEPFRVLARKYRPQTFPEVVGQQAIVTTLTNALSSGRIAHAYLFCGTRGVGKTTMARLLAKALNCEKGPTTEPCGTCDSCREIAAGACVDVLEIDGASHNKVDDVRDLQESLSYQPVRDRYRVIIIDEVHMLSRSAFNALLKTLEEPPEHVVFVMATTEFEKIPATILSRCQHFTFRRIRPADVEAHLQRVAGEEGVKISPTSLSLVARQAAGSMRDALSALDQVVSFCGNEIADDEVEAVLGALPASRVDELLAAVSRQDAAAALEALRVSEDRGDDPSRFADALVSRLRDLAVLAAAGEKTDLVEANDDERPRLIELAASLGEEVLLRLFQLASQLEPTLRHSRFPRVLLELAALKMVHAADLTPLAELAAGLAGSGGGTPAAGRGKSGGASARRRPAPGRDAGAGDAQAAAAAPDMDAVAPQPAASPPSRPLADGETRLDMERLRAVVETDRPQVAAFLEHATGILVNGLVRIAFSTKHSFFKKTVEIPANLRALQKALDSLLGHKVEIRLVLEERQAAPPAEQREPQQAQRRRLHEEARNQPAVKALNQVFGAEIVDIQPMEPGASQGSAEADT